MSKRASDKYRPGELPTELPALITHLYDEFARIAQALNEFPAGITVSEAATDVPVSTIPEEYRLFEGETPQYDLPGGGWNVAAGEWTVPLNGIYQININSTVAPFGAGNKDWLAEVRLYSDDVLAFESTSAGQDNFPLTCSMAISSLLVRESVLRATLTLVHDSFVGLVDVDSFMGITVAASE